MLLCLRYFPEFDREPVTDIFVGNCEVDMLSPAQYMACNYEFDMELVKYARKIRARFLVHQDSDVTPHIESYTKLEYVHGLDFGQDTDWEKAVRLFPDCDASCILFPSWVNAHSEEEIRNELLRLMEIGKRFKSFSFTLYEIDSFLGNKKIFDFYEIFKECAGKKIKK